MTNYIARGRQVVLWLTNKSAGSVAAGDVVILSSATAGAFITTTSAGQSADWVGVVLDTTIAQDAEGRVILSGYVPLITLSGAASLGDYLETHSVAKQAAPTGTRSAGAFGQVLATGTTPAAVIWGVPDSASSSFALDDLSDVDTSGVSDNDVLTYDNDTSTWIAAAPAGGSGDLTSVPLAVFVPPGEPTATVYATYDTRNQHPVMDFDAATDESIMFTGILGDHYAGGGVTVYLYIAATSDTDTNHKSYWDVSFEQVNGLDIDADSFAAAQSGNLAVPSATSGIPGILSIAFTDGAQMDSVAAGELFRIKITRDANNGSDDWTGDAELLCVKIKETV